MLLWCWVKSYSVSEQNVTNSVEKFYSTGTAQKLLCCWVERGISYLVE